VLATVFWFAVSDAAYFQALHPQKLSDSLKLCARETDIGGSVLKIDFRLYKT
jgi:hypothetical protein